MCLYICCVCTYIDVKGISFQSQSVFQNKKPPFWDMLSASPEQVKGPCTTEISSKVDLLAFSGEVFLCRLG